VLRLVALALLAASAALCFAQNAPPPPSSSEGTDFDNRHFHSTRFSIPPHKQLDLPKLPHEAVVISLSAGRLSTFPSVGSPETLDLVPGISFGVPGSSTDRLTNEGDAPLELLVLELKDSYAFNQVAVPHALRDPLEVDPRHVREELGNENVRILRLHLKPRESTEESQFRMSLEIPLTSASLKEIFSDGRALDRKLTAEALLWQQNFRMASLVNDGETPLDLLLVEPKHPFCYPLPHSLIPDGTEDKAKAYVGRALDKVRKNWLRHMPPEVPGGEPGYVVVSFKILNDGSLSDEGVNLVAAFADETLAGKVISAIRASSPFPPFPPELDQPELRTGFTVLYNLSVNTTPGCP